MSPMWCHNLNPLLVDVLTFSRPNPLEIQGDIWRLIPWHVSLSSNLATTSQYTLRTLHWSCSPSLKNCAQVHKSEPFYKIEFLGVRTRPFICTWKHMFCFICCTHQRLAEGEIVPRHQLYTTEEVIHKTSWIFIVLGNCTRHAMTPILMVIWDGPIYHGNSFLSPWAFNLMLVILTSTCWPIS